MKSTSHSNTCAPETKMETIGHQIIRTIKLDGELNGIQDHGMTETKKEKEILRPKPEAELKANPNQEVNEMKEAKVRLVATPPQFLPEVAA